MSEMERTIERVAAIDCWGSRGLGPARATARRICEYLTGTLHWSPPTDPAVRYTPQDYSDDMEREIARLDNVNGILERQCGNLTDERDEARRERDYWRAQCQEVEL